MPLIYSGFSQEARLGICLNPTLGWISENVQDMEKDGMKFGLEGGLILEYYFSDNYAFNTGLKLGNFGGKLVYNDTVFVNSDDREALINEVKYKMQYVSVPLGLKLKTNQIGYFSWYAQLGFTPQINIGAKAEVQNEADDINVIKNVALMNLSYHFGGGFEYGVGGETAILIGVLYNNGFMDVLTKQGDKEKLSFLTLQLGVMF